jgi:hypothetical protein
LAPPPELTLPAGPARSAPSIAPMAWRGLPSRGRCFYAPLHRTIMVARAPAAASVSAGDEEARA